MRLGPKKQKKWDWAFIKSISKMATIYVTSISVCLGVNAITDQNYLVTWLHPFAMGESNASQQKFSFLTNILHIFIWTSRSLELWQMKDVTKIKINWWEIFARDFFRVRTNWFDISSSYNHPQKWALFGCSNKSELWSHLFIKVKVCSHSARKIAPHKNWFYKFVTLF